MSQQALLLVFAVIAVGVLHTLVPDHWAPIALMARQRGWSQMQTARAAFGAGLGHTLSTLLIGLVVWVAGLAFALRFGHLVSLASSVALIGFGSWIAVSSWRELHGSGHHHEQEPTPVNDDRSKGSRMALLLILGSSPMVEGIPTFFAAAKFGIGLIAIMSFFFALSTIATYVVLCVYSSAALQRVSLGPVERYGEVLSGAFIAVVGIIFLIWPIA
jgi:ABC-type nickel/cobalt efflux system permease component RcnA